MEIYMRKIALVAALALGLFLGNSGADLYAYGADHWAAEAIEEAVDKEWIPTFDGTEPDRPITRAEFVSLLVNSQKLRGDAAATQTFTDVEESDWFYSPLLVARQQGIASGYPDGSFHPEAEISRQDVVVLLLMLAKVQVLADYEPLLNFTDENQIGPYARNAVALAVEKEYLQGYGDATLRPENAITIAEALTLNRAYRAEPFTAKSSQLSTLEITAVAPVSADPYHYTVTYQLRPAAELYYLVKYTDALPQLWEMDWEHGSLGETAGRTLETSDFAAEPGAEEARLWLLAVDGNRNYIWQSADFTLTPALFAQGHGTAEDPFVIMTEDDLLAVGQENFLNRHYILGEHITLTAAWIPLGTAEMPFSGVFNGNGKIIRDLRVNSNLPYVGLFGYVQGSGGEKAEISNLLLISRGVSGRNYVGGIAGYVGTEGIISACAVLADESLAYSAAVYAFGSDVKAGGLVGGNAGLIRDCYTNATTTAVSTGAELSLGGVAGVVSGTVQNSYSVSAVTGIASGGTVNVGGIAGRAADGIFRACLGINSTISGSGATVHSGRITGQDSGARIENCYGFAGNAGWGTDGGRDGTPVSGDETLYLDLYGPEGLDWDASEEANGSSVWLLDLSARYILPVLRDANLISQKNQTLPDHLLYF
jgi:hypothetical protein